MSLEILAARYALDMLPSDDLPMIATGLIIEGRESVHLSCLAGALGSAHPAQLRELFAFGLRDCGVPVPDRLDAAKRLVQDVATEVSDGTIAPSKGAELIADINGRVYEDLVAAGERHVGVTLGVGRVLGLYYELDELTRNGTTRRNIESELREECDHLASTRPSVREPIPRA